MTTAREADGPYGSLDAIRRLATAFERNELPPAALDHRMRLALGAWYLLERDEPDAVRWFLATLSKYHLAATNLPGELRYHETRTLFWLGLSRAILQAVDTTDRFAAVSTVLERCGDRSDLVYQYYSPALFNSWRATYGWVEPDLRPNTLPI